MKIPRTIKDNRFIRALFFLWNRNFGSFRRKRFGYIADNVVLTPPLFGDMHNIYIYENVSIGPNAHLSTPNAKIVFKGHTAVAEHLTIHTGNHARVVGCYVTDITEEDKPEGYDHDVVIENDVWIGANVTILENVTIGRGCTVAAGAVVAKSAPPYSIVGGIPAKVLKFYWTIEQILEHEATLYPEEQRYSKEYLSKIYAEHNPK